MKTYGIDPGITGAISLVIDGELARVADMPTVVASATGRVKRQIDGAGLAAVIRQWRAELGPDFEHAVIERVASMPGQGVASVFSLGHSAGVIAGVVAGLLIPSSLVAPLTWKREYGLGRDKAGSRAMASRLFPGHAGHWLRAKDDGRAEAVLIALWGHRTMA